MRALQVGRGISWPAAIASQAIGVLGMRGAGKSNFGRVIAEELFASSIPFVIFDPIGNWFGIRAGRDGRPGGGIPVPIFGGEHGDLQLDRNSGEKIADLVVDRRLSCVLDLSHADFSETDKRKFLVDFGERLFRKKSRESGWLNLIMEEADDYAPQSVHGGEKEGSTARTLGMFQRLVKRGRFKGLGDLLITQRSAAINKDLLYMVGTLVVFRTTGPRDQEAVAGWVKYNSIGEKVLESLSTLEDGEAWLISPEALGSIERVRFRRMNTYDTGATPEHGGQAKPATLADIDIPVLTAELQAAVERQKATDPRELQKKIAEQAAQIRALEKGAAVPAAAAAPKTVEKPVLKDAQIKRLERAVERLLGEMARVADALAQRQQVVVSEAGLLRLALEAAQKRTPELGNALAVGAGRVPAPSGRPAPVVSRPTPRPAEGNGDGRLGGPERKLLTILAQHPEGRTVRQLAVQAGYAQDGGGFRNPLGRIRSSGYVEPGDPVSITQAGLDVLGDFEPLPAGDALFEWWLSHGRLSGPEKKILRALAEPEPQSLSVEELARRTGYEPDGGGFRNPLGRLRTLELVTRGPVVRLSEELVG